jgi:hypothetical protein
VVNVWKILRSSTPGNRPSGAALSAGAPYVNFGEKQFGVVDFGSTPQDLIGVPFFSASANYTAGQPVNYLGKLYVALAAVPPGAWNAAQWAPVAGGAAPFDALAYNGLQINGGVEVSQENGNAQIYGGAGGTTVVKYIADGWGVASAGAQSISYGAAAAGITPPPGYSSNVGVWLNVANTSPAANDQLFFRHFIEGYRIVRLAWGTANAQPISIGFWFYSQRTGMFSGAVRNSAGTRSYVFTFTVNVASTWQWNTVTIAGDTAGTWLATNGVGIEVDFTLMAGSGNQTAAGAWVAGNFIGATGTINSISNTATGASAVTGLIVLPGLELPSAARAPFIMRPYDLELIACQRYLRYVGYGIWGYAETTTLLMFTYTNSLPVPRAIPTATTTGANVNVRRHSTGQDIGLTIGSNLDLNTSITGGRWAWQMGASQAVSVGEHFFLMSDNVIKLDARL